MNCSFMSCFLYAIFLMESLPDDCLKYPLTLAAFICEATFEKWIDFQRVPLVFPSAFHLCQLTSYFPSAKCLVHTWLQADLLRLRSALQYLAAILAIKNIQQVVPRSMITMWPDFTGDNCVYRLASRRESEQLARIGVTSPPISFSSPLNSRFSWLIANKAFHLSVVVIWQLKAFRGD